MQTGVDMAKQDELQEKLRQHGPITDLLDSGRIQVDNLRKSIGGEDVRWADKIKRTIGIAPGCDPEKLVPIYEKLRAKLIDTIDPDELSVFAEK